MRGPACNWWAKLTPFSLQADALVLTRDQRTLSGTVRVDFTFGKPVQNAHVKLSVVQNSAAAYGRPVVMDGTDGGPSGGGLGTVVATVTGKTDSKGAMGQRDGRPPARWWNTTQRVRACPQTQG